jgi:hypothetical protein
MSASTDLLFGPESRFETLRLEEQARRLETDDMSEWIRESAEQYVSADRDFRHRWEMAWLYEAERRIARAEAPPDDFLMARPRWLSCTKRCLQMTVDGKRRRKPGWQYAFGFEDPASERLIPHEEVMRDIRARRSRRT